MSYNCVVLIKQVPDTKRITGQAMNDDGTVNRSALPAIFNPEDLNALEFGLAIKDKFGGKLTVVTMFSFLGSSSRAVNPSQPSVPILSGSQVCQMSMDRK